MNESNKPIKILREKLLFEESLIKFPSFAERGEPGETRKIKVDILGSLEVFSCLKRFMKSFFSIFSEAIRLIIYIRTILLLLMIIVKIAI